MAENNLLDKELERVATSIGIPPCPGILLELSAEAMKEEPDFAKVENLVSKDVSLSASLLKTVNSPFYGLRNKISSVRQAISMLGINMLSRTISGLVLRNVFSGRDNVSMERFWDTSAKFALVTSYISRRVMGLNREDAYTYGLFQNCGIPILIQRYPDYKKTLNTANNSLDRKFTDIEDEAHDCDHATIGYLMTKSWSLPEHICSAVRFHHEYTMISEPQKLSLESKNLIALGLLADHIVQQYSGMNFSHEWTKGEELVKAHLQLFGADYQDVYDDALSLLEMEK